MKESTKSLWRGVMWLFYAGILFGIIVKLHNWISIIILPLIYLLLKYMADNFRSYKYWKKHGQ